MIKTIPLKLSYWCMILIITLLGFELNVKLQLTRSIMSIARLKTKDQPLQKEKKQIFRPVLARIDHHQVGRLENLSLGMNTE